jgi:hypothetical protein
MTDPATSKSGVALNVPTHHSAPLERVLCTEELCRSDHRVRNTPRSRQN